MMRDIEAKDILSEIEKIRISDNLPKDEKIEPLDKWDIDNLPTLPEGWLNLTSNEISTFITNGVHSPTEYY